MSEEPPSTEYDIAVLVEDPAWRRLSSDLEGLVRRAARAALVQHGTGRPAAAGPPAGRVELAVVLGDDPLVRRLNRDYRGQDRATNVLSFGDVDPADHAARTGARLLGDVVLARETVLSEAAAQDTAVADHVSHLVVHGVLHLLGHDHVTDAQAGAMEDLERAALARLGVADPYRDRDGPGAPR